MGVSRDVGKYLLTMEDVLALYLLSMVHVLTLYKKKESNRDLSAYPVQKKRIETTTQLKFNLKMYITIILLPFLGAILSGLFGRALGVKGVHIINVSCLLITTLLALIAYYEVVLCNSPVSIDLFSWINAEHLQISWGFYFDQLTVNMLIPVLIVSLLVHVYSIGYMGEDPHQQRFFSYISLFTGLMLVLVTGNNFLVMFLGPIYLGRFIYYYIKLFCNYMLEIILLIIILLLKW